MSYPTCPYPHFLPWLGTSVINLGLAAASAEDDVGWGDDSDDEDDKEAGPSRDADAKPKGPSSTGSSTTLHAPAQAGATLKPSSARRSSNDEKSQTGSDASYDVVGAASGVPSQAPSSPKEARKDDDSDEDWE